ncbi:MAG: hypothetical protein ACYTGX_03380 [Planctomycetota bacterium]
MQFPDTAVKIRMTFPAPPFPMQGPVEFSADCPPLTPHGHAKKK